MMASADSPLAELQKHLQTLADNLITSDCPSGCLVVNAAVEVAPQNPEVQAFVQTTFEGHISNYRKVLDAAKAKQELPANFDTLPMARSLFAILLGMSVLARAGMPKAVILAVRNQALEMISGNSGRAE
jgi:TetR/AcrR family transcriptional regulator, transcriptional repressor for nem operon